MVRYRDAAGQFREGLLERVADEDLFGGVAVRQFRWFKGRRFYSGWYWSATTRRMVVYESRLELARIMLADFDPSVVSIAAQPVQLTGPYGVRGRRHVPDLLLVDRADGVTIVDVKAPHKREDPQVRALMAWTRDVVGLRGWAFEEWYGAPRQLLANVGFLAGYRRDSVVDGSLVGEVLSSVEAGVTIVDVEGALRGHGATTVRPVVLHLLWRGLLTTDLTLPLGGLSVVCPGRTSEVAG